MKRFDNLFQRLCWQIQRDLHRNRKRIILLFGNGYESQIMLLALRTLGKKFTIVHAASDGLSRKTSTVLSKFRMYPRIILRPTRKQRKFKTFYCWPFSLEGMTCGFSKKDYLIVSGFQTGGEPILRQALDRNFFEAIYSPLLRCSDEYIGQIYQDMKDNHRLGSFMHTNLASDSSHRINIR